MKPIITDIRAIEILDSRGWPTLKTTITLEGGVAASASVPSGASTGTFEATELRDNDKSRFLGKGVLNAVGNVNGELAGALKGMAADEQRQLDEKMIMLDGTPNKSRLGANAILSVSLAAARAAAKHSGAELFEYLSGGAATTLPVPMCNVINGGAHASNNLDIQEFMIVPTGAAGFSEAIRKSAEVFQHLKKLLISYGLSAAVGDEGGFAPDLRQDTQALNLLSEAVRMAGYEGDMHFALDAASTEWIADGDYLLPKSRTLITKQAMAEYWENMAAAFPIISIEDGANEEDWELWQLLNKKLGGKVQLVGDDLFVTNTERLKKGIALNAANSILIKPNQIGTLTETIRAIDTAKAAGYTTIMSHRSGETEDSIIADLAVGLATDQIKTGSLSRSERTAKYNRLLEIEYILGERAVYKGINAFR